jgi:hypothetical protein
MPDDDDAGINRIMKMEMDIQEPTRALPSLMAAESPIYHTLLLSVAHQSTLGDSIIANSYCGHGLSIHP